MKELLTQPLLNNIYRDNLFVQYMLLIAVTMNTAITNYIDIDNVYKHISAYKYKCNTSKYSCYNYSISISKFNAYKNDF
jgi:hypothetical protein